MTRSQEKENLQGDIPKALSQELIEWTVAHKGNSKRQCLQAAVELWMKLPDPIKALTLICDRDGPLFGKLAREISESLQPLADLFVEPERIDARSDFRQIRAIAERLRPDAYARLTGAESELLDRLLRLFSDVEATHPPAPAFPKDVGDALEAHLREVSNRPAARKGRLRGGPQGA